jgi:D-alanyl-D-alanine carboxypeptidase (penicillin-binding protein 5/6)
MKKTLAALGVAGALGLCLITPAAGEELVDVVETDAAAYVLMEQETGRVLVGKNIHDRLEPASVTKIMTMLLVVEALDGGTIHTDDLVTTSDHAASMGGSQIYLEPGETMTVDDLLKSVAVVSANDAAVALAEYVAGSETAFVERMNAKAAELGMEDTTFVNCNGLPAEGHLTCAYDIALMSRELMTHSRIQDYTTIWMDSVRDGEFSLSNTNKLIKTYSGITGLKTGYTDSARYCLSATSEREGMGLIATVLGASTSQLRFETASQLMDYGYATYSLVTVEPEGEIPTVPVKGGEAEAVQPILAGSNKLLLPKTQAGEVTTRLELEPEVSAPVEAGDPVGTLVVYVGDEVEEKLTLTAAESVPQLTFRTLFVRLWTRMGMRG